MEYYSATNVLSSYKTDAWNRIFLSERLNFERLYNTIPTVRHSGKGKTVKKKKISDSQEFGKEKCG